MARNQKTRMKIIFQLKRVNLSVLLFLRILVNLPVFIFFLIFQLFPPVLLITTNYFIHDQVIPPLFEVLKNGLPIVFSKCDLTRGGGLILSLIFGLKKPNLLECAKVLVVTWMKLDSINAHLSPHPLTCYQVLPRYPPCYQVLSWYPPCHQMLSCYYPCPQVLHQNPPVSRCYIGIPLSLGGILFSPCPYVIYWYPPVPMFYLCIPSVPRYYFGIRPVPRCYLGTTFVTRCYFGIPPCTQVLY